MAAPLKPLKWYKKLATKKGRLEVGAFPVEGEKAIRQVLDNRPQTILEILTVAEPALTFRQLNVRLVTESQFRSISNTRTPQGIMAIVRLPAEIYSDSLPDDTGAKVLLLEDIQDPGNLGTLIRTAAAFDFSGVIMTEGCADLLSPKCVQSTAGTFSSLWLRRTGHYFELAGDLKKKGYTLVMADLDGTAEPSVLCRQKRLVLVLGNESTGLSREFLAMADYRLRILMTRKKAESLNAAVCGAICMYLTSQDS
jgi:TrmH family RNA methyltransferase